jgi:carbamoyl-phosphate synthase large subunit
MNILLTCVGRRRDVVEGFKRALGGKGLLFACDSDADAPALRFADKAIVVPSIGQPGYIDALVKICRENAIRMVVPAFEPELPLLANSRARFLEAGALPLVSSAAVLDLCYDKTATDRFLGSCGLESPWSCTTLAQASDAVAAGKLSFPLIVKPRWGVSSIETEQAQDAEELELLYRLVRKRLARTMLAEISATDPEHSILIQQRVSGIEYGLDVVNDLKGNYACALVKRKIRMRSGQTDRAVTCEDPELEALGRRLGEKLGHVGVLDCDVIVDGSKRYVLDLNPRIGGGYPFSQAAGADVPAALIAWAEGRPPDPRWLKVKPNVRAARFDSLEVL